MSDRATSVLVMIGGLVFLAMMVTGGWLGQREADQRAADERELCTRRGGVYFRHKNECVKPEPFEPCKP